MKKFFDFLSSHKYAIIWTLCYVATMWFILKFMFSFDMFSGTHWNHLMRAELRGFPGFVFGILILAALPLYIASTTLIIRTKKPLLSIPVPNFIKKLWSHMQPTLINPPASPENKEEKAENKNETDANTLPPELPSELRTAYIRAQMNITPEQRSAFNQPMLVTSPVTDISAPAPEPELTEIPLPTDFEFEPTNTPDYDTDNLTQMSAPTFTDITFDDNTTTNPIAEYLNNIGTKFETFDNIITTDKHAIATHNDDDFWVCDDDFWFATGKQIESPIKQLSQIANERNLSPILYLGASNIMDLDKLIPTWESMGVTIITTPDQIPE